MALIRDVLGALPLGGTLPLTWPEVGDHIRKLVNSPSEVDRQRRARFRQELYSDGGTEQMLGMLQSVFNNAEVAQLRKVWVQFSGHNNLTRRITNKIASIYRAPVIRRVGDSDNERYRALQRVLRKDAVMRHTNRMLVLHRRILLGVRVRSADLRPIIDVILPHEFWIIRHPNDATLPVAFLFLSESVGPRVTEKSPRYTLYSDTEHVRLDMDFRVMESTLVNHGFDEMPFILADMEPQGVKGDDSVGEALTAGHRAVWFEMLTALKESKSANKQTVLQGDLSNAVRGQVQDSESDLELPDGVIATNLDRGVDIGRFMELAKQITSDVAANHDISSAELHSEGASSGHEIELRRLGLREQRLEQLPVFQELERELAFKESMVMRANATQFAFSPEAFGADFPEPEVPLSQTEQDEVFETRRRLGLTDTIEEIMRRDPDLNEEQAFKLLAKRAANELQRNLILRPLAAISGSPGANTPDSVPDDDSEDESDSGGQPLAVV